MFKKVHIEKGRGRGGGGAKFWDKKSGKIAGETYFGGGRAYPQQNSFWGALRD